MNGKNGYERFIFDTSVLIDLQMKKEVTQRQVYLLLKDTQHRPAIPYISYYEFFYGIVNEKNLDRSLQFLNAFFFLSPTKKTAILQATMRRKLEKRGLHFSMPDLLIACQAIEHRMTIITKDKAFIRIPGISVRILD